VTEYRGIIENGVIKPFQPIDFPDGTEVAFHEIGNGAKNARSAAPPSEDRFRRGYSITQLAREQGVAPFASLEELAGEWPDEDDFEEFLRSIREWRR